MALDRPETRYVDVGDVQVAYQVIGDGPLDLVYHHGTCHLDLQWEVAAEAAFNLRLASFSRLILFDRRGIGASERLGRSEAPTLDDWMEDVLAVLDAVGSTSAALFFESDAGAVAINLAAQHPERVVALVLANTAARYAVADDYLDGWSQGRIEETLTLFETIWGTPAIAGRFPLVAGDPAQCEALARLTRAAATPGSAIAHYRRIWEQMDVRELLGRVSSPTLVISTPGNEAWSRYLAEGIPHAELVDSTCEGSLLFGDEFEETLSDVASFLTGNHLSPAPLRQLVTVLFTDIVASTERLSASGNQQWRRLLDAHDRTVRDELARFGGREVNTTGDGFVAAFETPSTAMRCGERIVEELRALGIEVRAGVHTGECEIRGDDLSGMAVHVAARVAAAATPGQVLVTKTVVDLVLGSGARFDDCGEFDLKGVPGQWSLFAVAR